MTESELKRLCLLSAFERDPTPPWTAADSVWVSDEARRRVGGTASLDTWAARRADLGLVRLGERSAALKVRLAGATESRLHLATMASLALVVGMLGGALVSSAGDLDRINLLALPMLGLLLWNAGLYGLLLVRGGCSRWPGRRREDAAGPALRWVAAALRPVRDGLARWAARRSWAAHPREADPPEHGASASSPHAALLRFQSHWLQQSAGLWAARLQCGLHLMAAALAIGALSALYIRGLAFELRASWDSTFFTAADALFWVRAVLGPASALSGLPLPAPQDDAAFEALRGARGGGENAAHWIHLWALTLLAFVVLPRLLLAAWSGARARALSAQMPVDWRHDPVLARLAVQHGRGGMRLRVLPYRYAVGPAAREFFRERLTAALGQAPVLQWADPAAEGDEEAAAARGLDDMAGQAWPVVLASAAHTPEHETHGRFLEAVARQRPTAAPALLLVDEAGFGTRWSAADAAQRRVERRAAWRGLAEALGHEAVFVSTAAPADAPGAAGFDELAMALSTPQQPA